MESATAELCMFWGGGGGGGGLGTGTVSPEKEILHDFGLKGFRVNRVTLRFFLFLIVLIWRRDHRTCNSRDRPTPSKSLFDSLCNKKIDLLTFLNSALSSWRKQLSSTWISMEVKGAC